MRLLKQGLITAITLLVSTNVYAGMPIGMPAQEYTQILNHLQLLGLSEKQIQLAVTALKTLEEAQRAGQLLSHQQWGNAQLDLINIGQAVQVGQGLGFSLGDMDATFRNTYPGFKTPGVPFWTQYQKWSTTTMDTIEGSLRANGVSWQQLQNEQLMQSYLQRQSESAVGQTQAIQVGVQAGIEEIGQLRKLRALMLTDMQSKQAYQAYQVQKDMRIQQVNQNFFTPVKAGRDHGSF